MGMLVNGNWQDEDARQTNTRANKKGEFVRQASPFRNWLGAADSPFVIEAGRYHLFVNAGCPWAYRTLLYRSIKGLQDIVGVSYTEAAAGDEGWTFGTQPEPLLGAQYMHNIYSRAEPTFTGRATVPVLWDWQEMTIVNNESADIIRMFNNVFNDLEGVNKTNYYPADIASEIDELNEKIYTNVNNGVYRCGFAQSQEAYEDAFDALFQTLDELDLRLGQQRFLCGTRITEADWRLFATLVRFDLAYYGQFRCNRNMLRDFPNLWPYTRDLYQQPGVAETVDIDAIKGIYYGSRAPRILPKGPIITFNELHQRHRLDP